MNHKIKILFLLIVLVISCDKKSNLYKIFNPNYKNDTIRSVNMPDNFMIINKLKKELEKNNFEIGLYEVNEAKPQYNFIYDCEKLIKYNTQYKRVYTIESMYDLRKTRKYKYNFTIRVYEFKDEQTAEENYKILDSVITENQFCNSNFNYKFVQKNNEIFEFTTMGDKSISQMVNYVLFVKDN